MKNHPPLILPAAVRLGCGLILLVMLAVPALPAARPARAQSSGSPIYLPMTYLTRSNPTWTDGVHCECVQWVVKRLFGGGLDPRDGHDWGTPLDMATEIYWGQEAAGFRHRVQVPTPGDAIIINPDAPFEVMQTQGFLAGTYKPVTLNNGAGHIGIVTEATYNNDKWGWDLQILSANWEDNFTWIWEKHTENGCNNVASSTIFVPNGPGISFWSEGPFEVVNDFSGNCLDVPGGSSAQTELIHWPCNGGANQKWKIWDPDDQYEYRFESNLTTMCMDIPGATNAEWAYLIQYNCNGGANQKFTLDPIGDGSYWIRSVSNGMCLAISYDTEGSGRIAQTAECFGSHSLRWWLR